MKPNIMSLQSIVVHGLITLLSLFIAGCAQEEEEIEILSPAEIFQTGSPIPLEILYYQPVGEQDVGSFYLSELVMTTKTDATISFKDLKSGERVAQRLVLSEAGIDVEGDSPSTTGFNDFVSQNYSEWCGKWHKGIWGSWRMCTGSDCKDGIAICFQRKLPNL